MTVHEFPRDHGSLANLDKDHHPQYHEEGTLYPNLLTVEGGVDAYIAQDTYDVNTRGDDALIPDGVSFMQSKTGGWPTTYSADVMIRTYKASRALQGTIQYAIDQAQDPPEVWVRRWKIGSGGSWSAWVLLTVTPWQSPALQSGWVDYGGGWEESGYRKVAGNTVQLRGLIRDGTGKIVFYLPAGYRPPQGIICMGRSSTGAARRIDVGVGTNGDQVQVNDTLDVWQSLSGISFSVD